MQAAAITESDVSTFTPGPATALQFRQALGRFVTGVTVVTIDAADGPMGMTVNSFTSVSLDPPLVLWCPARASRRHAAFTTAEHFAIHVLDEGQLPLARRFASGSGSFGAGAAGPNPEGVPVLDDVLARFDCRLETLHEAGDHSIVVGRVLRARQRPGAPLVFAGGDFGQFSSGV